jgi:predicted DNA-binding protein
MKKKVKPTSVRLDNELLDELDQRCGKLGCSRNDFIKNSVDFIINQSSEFNFGDDEETMNKPIVEEELRLFNCELGIMYEKGIVIGDCSEFHLDHGKVYDKNRKQIGNIGHESKDIVNVSIVSE